MAGVIVGNAGAQELASLNPHLHYVYCGESFIRTVCGGEVLDVVCTFSLSGCHPYAGTWLMLPELLLSGPKQASCTGSTHCC